MVDRALVERKLRELEQTVASLRSLQGVSTGEMVRSPERAWSVEHGLQIAIQLILDIGSHLLAAMGVGDIDDYADVLDGLGKEGVLPLEFAKEIRPMAGFRNVLVHGYAKIDLDLVAEFLHGRLEDFQTYARHIQRYLDRHST